MVGGGGGVVGGAGWAAAGAAVGGQLTNTACREDTVTSMTAWLWQGLMDVGSLSSSGSSSGWSTKAHSEPSAIVGSSACHPRKTSVTFFFFFFFFR